MSNFLDHFQVLSLYSNEEIFRALGVGNAGGMRIRSDATGDVRRAALFTSIPTVRQATENPYHDRMEGNVLVYTGTGKSGDQVASGVNARIPTQLDSPFPIYGFVQIRNRRAQENDNKRWQFVGLLEYLRCYKEQQLDSDGKPRSVWLFELLVHSNPQRVCIEEDSIAATALYGSKLHPLSLTDREVLASLPSAGAGQRGIALNDLEPVRRNLLSLEPRAFEAFVGNLLRSSGFTRIEVTRYSQDGGIDINARPAESAWAIRDLLVQIQAKRWLHTVGRREVAELRGSLQPHAAGCIVTTSHFSRAALAEATEAGKVPITVVDGYQLAALTISAGQLLP